MYKLARKLMMLSLIFDGVVFMQSKTGIEMKACEAVKGVTIG